jgi:PhnB protein
MKSEEDRSEFRESMAPWLPVRGSARAVDFYKAAFGAVETYRLDDRQGGVVCRLSVGQSEFWVSDESPEHGNFSPETLGGATTRMVLTVNNPDAVFAHVLTCGATEVYPVMEEHGWRIGRIKDPFGHHWEIGRQVDRD